MGPIVVATDLSPTTHDATATAIGLARAASTAVHLVHAWQPTTVVALDAALIASPQRVAQVTAERQRAMDELLARFATPGVSLTGHLLDGEVSQVLADFARTAKASMVVVGTSLPRGLRAALLGSVADQITRTAPCPVLVVRASGQH